MSSLCYEQQQHPRRGSADSGIPSSSLSTFQAVGPLTSASSFFSGGKQPRTPSSSGSATPSLSLAAKRTRISPGTIDLSSLPRFPPSSPPPATLVTAASTDAPAPSSGGQGAKTPQALTNGLFGSGSGSTPRALFPPTRPGLTSRWSTDSSGSDRAGSNSTSPVTEMRPIYENGKDQAAEVDLESDSEGSTSGSSCMSEDCETCDARRMPSARLSQGAFPEAVDEAEDADGEEDAEEGQEHFASTASQQQRRRSSLLARSASTATITAEHSGNSPTSFGTHFRPSPSQSPYSPALNAFSNEAIRSPLPAFVAERSDMFPPAPKPHQMGFSPFVEEPVASTSGEQQILLPSQTLERTSPNDAAPRRCRKCKRSHQVESSSSSSGSAASSQTSDETLSPTLLCPRPESEKPLTRSQGLRIRDEGSSRPKGRYARVLSAQLHSSSLPSSSSSKSNGGGPNSSSSTMKTASALLDGTVSPAATSTDPLRVRLREMPGAITPGSQPPTPSPANAPHQLPSPSRTLAAYSLTSPPKIARSTSASSSSSSSGRSSNAGSAPKKSSWLSPAQMSDRRPSSPLHISTLADDADDDNEAGLSSSSKTAAATRKVGGDTKHDIFSRSFSFVNLESPVGGAGGYIRSPLASPRSTMPTIKETEAQKTESQQGLKKVNPYFAGYI